MPVVVQTFTGRAETPEELCKVINAAQRSEHNVFATDTHYDPDNGGWVAIFFERIHE